MYEKTKEELLTKSKNNMEYKKIFLEEDYRKIHNRNILLINKIGKDVTTVYGEGIVVDIDLICEDCWRWVIELHSPSERGKKFLKGSIFEEKQQICMYDKEVKFI